MVGPWRRCCGLTGERRRGKAKADCLHRTGIQMVPLVGEDGDLWDTYPAAWASCMPYHTGDVGVGEWEGLG